MRKNYIAAILSLIIIMTITAGCGAEGSQEPTPLPTISLAPTITAPPTPTPTPKPSIGPYFEPTVTKSPGAENKVEGSAIYFSSFADDMVRCEWELVKDEEVIPGAQIADSFDGLVAAGIYDNYLVLGNIPLELDGWSVRCRFIGSGEATVYSEPALINVFERKVKLHGEERKTVKGTGNLSGYGALIDFEGAYWWDVEEYTDAVFTLLPEDAITEPEISEAAFQINADGSLHLKLGETEYSGFVNTDRLGGHAASAGVFRDDSDAELTIWFDYTQESQSREDWSKIFLEIPMELPAEKKTEPSPAPDAVSEEDAAQQQGKAEAESEAEPQTVTVKLILTRAV